MELMYASSGMIQGSSDTPNVKGVTLTAPIDGVWNVDDSGRICTSMVIGRNMLPLRCQFWFKYKEDYFVADSDSDRYVKVFRRSVKP
jgi:hypothetical protein